MQAIYDKAVEYFFQYGLGFIYALLILIAGRWAARIASIMAARALAKMKLSEAIVSFLRSITYYVLLAVVVIAALNMVGVETTSVVALIGAAGLAIGLALQGSLANFAAGVMLILTHPFTIGDLVEAGGATGTVKEIQIFNTILESGDGKKVIVPNAKITSDKIVVSPRPESPPAARA